MKAVLFSAIAACTLFFSCENPLIEDSKLSGSNINQNGIQEFVSGVPMSFLTSGVYGTLKKMPENYSSFEEGKDAKSKYLFTTKGENQEVIEVYEYAYYGDIKPVYDKKLSILGGNRVVCSGSGNTCAFVSDGKGGGTLYMRVK